MLWSEWPIADYLQYPSILRNRRRLGSGEIFGFTLFVFWPTIVTGARHAKWTGNRHHSNAGFVSKGRCTPADVYITWFASTTYTFNRSPCLKSRFFSCNASVTRRPRKRRWTRTWLVLWPEGWHRPLFVPFFVQHGNAAVVVLLSTLEYFGYVVTTYKWWKKDRRAMILRLAGVCNVFSSTFGRSSVSHGPRYLLSTTFEATNRCCNAPALFPLV